MTAYPATVWLADDLLQIGDVPFEVAINPNCHLTESGHTISFVVARSKPMIDDNMASRETDETWNHIIEADIFKGGSAAMLGSASPDATVSALDHDPEPSAELDRSIQRHGLGDRVHPWFDVDQADVSVLAQIVESDHGGEPLDLVIDDTSYFNQEFARDLRGSLCCCASEESTSARTGAVPIFNKHSGRRRAGTSTVALR